MKEWAEKENLHKDFKAKLPLSCLEGYFKEAYNTQRAEDLPQPREGGEPNRVGEHTTFILTYQSPPHTSSPFAKREKRKSISAHCPPTTRKNHKGCQVGQLVSQQPSNCPKSRV